jgi:hypothetical protein
VTPEETQRMLADAEANRLESIRYTKQRRRPVLLVIALAVVVGLLCGSASAVVLALLHDDPSAHVEPLITGAVTGTTAFIGVGFVQPWAARRRQRRNSSR